MNNSPCDIELINADCETVMLSKLRERGYKLYNFNISVLKYLNETVKRELLIFTDEEINDMINKIDDISFFVIKLCLVSKPYRFIDLYINKLKQKNSGVNDEIATIILATTKINICDKPDFAFICKDGCKCAPNYTEYLFEKLIDVAILTDDNEVLSIMVSNIAILLNITALYSTRSYELCMKIKNNQNELKKLVYVGKLYSTKYIELLNDTEQIGTLNFKLVKMIDGIYIGNKEAATNQSLIIDNDIKNIISLITINKSISNVNYLTIPIDDTPIQKLDEAITKSYEFIINCVSRNEKILCHCAKGISRSPAILIAYLMKRYGWEYEKSYQMIENMDKSIRINTGFIEQLRELEQKI